MPRRQDKPLTVTLHVEGVKDTLDKFNELPKEANDAIKDRATEIARPVAERVRSAAKSRPQDALLAPTVRVRRDRLPVVIAGGAKKVGRNRVPAYKVLFGSEFGSNHLKQFRPHLGQAGYWFFPTIEDAGREISDAWNQAAGDVIDEFTEGGSA